jgi:hypothetical protein
MPDYRLGSGHIVLRQAGDIFRGRARPEVDKGRVVDALFNVAVFLHKTLLYACRAIKETPPEEILTELHGLLRSFMIVVVAGAA